MTKTISLAIYLHNLMGGGVERVQLNLISAFVEYGCDVTIVLDEIAGELLSQVPEEVTVVTLNVKRTMFALPKLVGYLRTHAPDILLSNLGHNNIIALWARKIAQVPTAVIVCQHNALSNETKEIGNWQHRTLPHLYQIFAKWADAIVAVSTGVADDMATTAKIPRNSISVIHNPVVMPDFPERMNERATHEWLEIENSAVYVAVGRLVPQKDFTTLLHAFALLRPALNAHLIILGEGPLRAELVSLCEALGITDRVRFLGFQANPLPYIKRASALVMSSRYEGFGNVLVEALACGSQVVSTDCPHGPSEILDDGAFGLLVPVGDAEAMAVAMEGILVERIPQEKLTERAEQFTLQRIGNEYLELFKAVLLKKTITLED